jgi:MFS family permease
LGIIAQVTLVAFEALAVSTAMPVIAEALDGVRGYGLAFSLFLTMTLLGTVVAGGWCDVSGPRWPAVTGLALFAAGLVVSGLAGTFEVMLLGRVVSGVGGGFTVVALYVIVAAVYPEQMRPQVFGWISAAWVLPSLLGPPIAGWLATDVSWRVVFLGVPPLVLLATLALWPRLKPLGPAVAAEQAPGRHRRRALLGLALAVGATALQWGSQRSETSGAAAGAVTAGALLAGAALVAVALPRLVPKGTLRAARGLPSVIAVRGLFTACFFGAETFVPLMLVSERGLSPAVAGLSLTGGAVGWATGSWLQGRPGLRVPRHGLLGIGGFVVGLSVLGLLLALLPGVPAFVVLPVWTVAGVGMGIGMSSTSVLVLGLSRPGEEGRNSAALQVSDARGGVTGIGAAGAVFAALHVAPGADTHTFTVIWASLAVVGVLAAAVGVRARSAPASAGSAGPSGSSGSSDNLARP